MAVSPCRPVRAHVIPGCQNNLLTLQQNLLLPLTHPPHASSTLTLDDRITRLPGTHMPQSSRIFYRGRSLSSKVATATQAKLPPSRPFLPRRRHQQPQPRRARAKNPENLPERKHRHSRPLGRSDARTHSARTSNPILGSLETTSRTGRPRNLQRVPQTQAHDGPWPGSTHTCTHSRTHTFFTDSPRAALLISSPAADKLPRQRPTTHRANLAPTVGLTRPGCLAGRPQRLNVRPAWPAMCGRAGAELHFFLLLPFFLLEFLS